MDKKEWIIIVTTRNNIVSIETKGDPFLDVERIGFLEILKQNIITSMKNAPIQTEPNEGER